MNCLCGHNLGVHIPDPAHQFAWPCKLCDCAEYRETQPRNVIYLLGAASREYTILYVRITLGNDRHYHVYEGLTNR